MFAILHDSYGNLYNATYVDYARTRDEAMRKMNVYVTVDCREFDKDPDDYTSDGDDYAFTPKGEDGCYKIIELPGAYIPKNVADSFLESINEASEMYNDDSRTDWFDADDGVRQVCWELTEYLD